MATFFKRVFNIREDELLVFTAFFFFYFLIGIQFSIGLAISEALFLSEVGPQWLPVMYIFNAFVIILVSGGYSSLTVRLSIPAMFRYVLLFFICLILGIRLLIGAGIQAYGMPIAFPLLHTLFVMFTNMLPNNFRTLYGLYLDVLQSKRLVPIILTGGRYGGIAGGLMIPLLVTLLGSVANVLFVWIGAILLSFGFVHYIQHSLKDHLLEGAATSRKKGGAKKGGKSGGNIALMKTNKYVAAFALFSFFVVILRGFQDFQYSVVFREVFQDKAQLAAFLGYFTAIGSAFSLLVQTFITPRVIRRLGIGTANIFYPITTLIGLFWMFVYPSFLTAVFLRFNNKNLQESIRNPINALLYNALSPAVRGRVGAFVAGQVVAVASIVSGVILLIIKPTGLALFPLSPRWLAFISIILAVAYLASGFLMRREYGAALRKMLEEKNLGLFKFAQEGFGTVDQKSMEILKKNVREGDDDVCLFAAGMLSEKGGVESLEIILDEIPRRKGYANCGLISLLSPWGKDDERVRRVWGELLASPDPGCRIASMGAVAKAGLIDEYVEQIHESLEHDSAQVRTQAVELLVQSGDLFWLASGLQTLHTMLESNQKSECISALGCIGHLENPRFIRRLVPFLQNSEREVREAAMDSIERLLPERYEEIEQIENILETVLKDTHPPIRQRGVRLLGLNATRSNFERLVMILSDPDAEVRRETVNALKAVKGRFALRLEGGSMFKFMPRLLVRWSEKSVDEMTEEDLESGIIAYSLDHLREVYEIINHLKMIEQNPHREKFFMLRKALWEKVQERQVLLLELLGVIGDEKTVDTVSESLARGESSSRAIAIEALSNVSSATETRQLILLLEPLLLSGSAAEKLEAVKGNWEISPIDLDAVLQMYVQSTDSWVRAITIVTAGNLLSANGLPAQIADKWVERIQALFNDSDPYVREAVTFTLGQLDLQTQDIRKWMDAALHDKDERVVAQARRVLDHPLSEGGGEPPHIRGDGHMLSTIEKALFLKGVNLFESMNAEQLKIISNISKEINVSSENVLFEEGDSCDYLYIIVEGEIDIVKALGRTSEETLATLGPPASFGEMAVFGDEGRSASARAAADSTLLGIEKDHLLELIREQHALSIEIIRRLAAIIRSQDQARAAAHQDD